MFWRDEISEALIVAPTLAKAKRASRTKRVQVTDILFDMFKFTL